MKLRLESKNRKGDLYINNNDKKGWEVFCKTIQNIDIECGIYDVQIIYSEKYERKIPMILVESDKIPIYPHIYPNIADNNLSYGITVGQDEEMENSILVFEKLMDMFKKNNKKHSMEIS